MLDIRAGMWAVLRDGTVPANPLEPLISDRPSAGGWVWKTGPYCYLESGKFTSYGAVHPLDIIATFFTRAEALAYVADDPDMGDNYPDGPDLAPAPYMRAEPQPPGGWNVMQLGQVGWHVVQSADGWAVSRLFGPEILPQDGNGEAVTPKPVATREGGHVAADAPAPAPVVVAELTRLEDPVAVHANMLRGTIAKPTLEQIIHLYGADALCKALAPMIVREANADGGPMWCDGCRATGAVHCAHPDECGNMLSATRAADQWKAWIDDLPLPYTFDPAIGRLQDFITALTTRIDVPQPAPPLAPAPVVVDWKARAEAAEARVAEMEADDDDAYERGLRNGEATASALALDAHNRGMLFVVEMIEKHFPGTLYASNRTKILEAIAAAKEPRHE